MNSSTQSWVTLRTWLLNTLGELVCRTEGIDDHVATLAEITRAIDMLALIGHPLSHVDTGVRQ